MKFVSLHHHSTFSYGDGYGMPDDHVARAADLGMSAIAHTEHGNVSSMVKLEQAGHKHDMKSIFGLEAYTGPEDMRETKNRAKWHLTILAADQTGYQNLMRLTTRAWSEGFYQYPTVTASMLKDHHEGLIILSGCLASKLACDLLGGKGREKGDIRDAERTLKSFKRLLGDRFYLETQQFPELSQTRKLNAQYEEWSKKYGIPLVATADVHYPMPDQNEMQKILHAARRNLGTVEAAQESWEYDIRLTLPVSDAQILKRLRGTGLSRSGAQGAIQTTADIADRCNVVLPKMERVRFPMVDTPGMTSGKLIRMWLNDGWKTRGFHRFDAKTQKEYKNRIRYELSLIEGKDFTDYFLVLSDLTKYVKSLGVMVGPGRGSAAASLVCYTLQITEINPMQFPLMMFERFIAPDRYDLPDVDLDFPDDSRDLVRQRAIDMYGEDRVGNIATATRYRGKNSIDDVARVYSIPKWKAEKVKSFIPERVTGDDRFEQSIEDTVSNFPEAKRIFEEHPQLNRAMDLEGNLKSFGVHASGFVIGNEPLWNYVATYSRKMSDGRQMQVLSVDKYDGDHLGLLKIDSLGLKTMGAIQTALKHVGLTPEHMYNLPLDDPKVISAFERADVTGIFQFEGNTMRLVTKELMPSKFMDLSAINALARPGPYHSGSTGEYISIRRGRMEREKLHPIVDAICEETEGQIIYQEQILKICTDVGNFEWSDASKVRKIIQDKRGERAFSELWEKFRAGAKTHGINEQTARNIWQRMVTAGMYAFNVAHCVSYSVVGYWMMWLKVHHPLAFYAAQLNKIEDEYKKLDIMRDLSGHGYEILPPDISKPAVDWTPSENGVHAGFRQIPGVGRVTAQNIMEFAEKSGGIPDWDSLVLVSGIGSKTIQKMKAFVESDDPFGVRRIERETGAIKKWISEQKGELPMPDTESSDIPFEAKRSSHVVLGLIKDTRTKDLYESHRSRNGEELDPATVRDPQLSKSMTVYLEDEQGSISLNVNRWTLPKFEEALGNAKIGHDYVLAKALKKPHTGKTIHATQLWVIDPD